MIISIEGDEATGKSTFAYTAPLPIVGFSLDMGTERAIYGTEYERHFKGLDIEVVSYPDEIGYEVNDITIYEMPAPIQMNPDSLTGYMEQWNYFMNIFAKAVQDPAVKTVVIDTMTLLRKNKCDAYLQEIQEKKPRKQLLQIEYGHPDGEIRRLFTFAQALKKNLVVVHHLRPVYETVVTSEGVKDSMPNGKFEHDGVRDINRLIDIRIRNTKIKGVPSSEICKCGSNLGLEGNKLPGMTWNMLVSMLEADWHGTPFDKRKELEEIASE